ncbi:hypothetical protein SBDP1_1410014 [Syntrophobacter sp. SbD1]|nr:hypothetical protein SBDP1_1410014 [Syntrophobacter sp. SbD1]
MDFVLEKRRLGKSIIAQYVGIKGRMTIAITISNFKGLKVIYRSMPFLDQLPASILTTGREFINFRTRCRKSQNGSNPFTPSAEKSKSGLASKLSYAPSVSG